MTLQIKRVYEPVETGDGYRVLVDRLWPRGLAKARAQLDDWDKEVAPSPELRTWFGHRADRFAEFSERYRAELRDSEAFEGLLRTLADHERVTLLYAARDPEINHAVVLRAALGEAMR